MSDLLVVDGSHTAVHQAVAQRDRAHTREVIHPPQPAPPIPERVLLSDLISTLLKEGRHPQEIRRELQRQGVRWSYTFSGGSRAGKRERARRLRQAHLCEQGCGRYAPAHRTPQMCDGCLSAAWN